VLAGENFEAVLAVTGHVAGDTVDGEVRVALTTTARFEAAASVRWYCPDLRSFQRQLDDMYSSLSGVAELWDCEARLELRVELEDGRGTISGRVGDPALGTRLEFKRVPTDQSYLREAIAGFRRIGDALSPR
jgi:hypothetical protein